MDRKKAGPRVNKTIALSEEDAYHLHETLRKLRALNVQLFDMLMETLEHNARLASALKDAYPYIAERDRGAMGLDKALGIERSLVKEKAT